MTKRPSPELIAVLDEQFREFYLPVEHEYADYEAEALNLFCEEERSNPWTRFAVRRFWHDQVGDPLPEGWQENLVKEGARIIAKSKKLLSKQLSKDDWIDEDLVAETLAVWQRRTYRRMTVRAAVQDLRTTVRLVEGD